MSDNVVFFAEINEAIEAFLEAVAESAHDGCPFPQDALDRVCMALENGGIWLMKNANSIAADPAVDDKLAACWGNIVRLQGALERLAQSPGLKMDA